MEILQLQNTFENEQNKLMEELVKLQNLYNYEKEKSFWTKIADFREDVLKMKKEKKELKKSLKIKSYECESGLVPEFKYNDSHICEICQARCNDMHDLERHLATFHYIESKLEVLDGDCFQCDLCPLNYKKRIDLDFHKRGYHWG